MKDFKEKMLKLIGHRVMCGSRPYPYSYQTSKGIVTHIEFPHENYMQAIFYTDKGEVIRSQCRDLIYKVVD